MEDIRRTDWIIASYVAPQAFARHTRAALAGLGYRVVPAANLSKLAERREPDLRIVDARDVDRLPREDFLPRSPIIVLSGPRQAVWRDPRIVGAIARPADLGEIYPLLQTALENHPRRTARAATRLPARCTRADRGWMGAIVSLSAGGCLFKTRSELVAGQELNLHFPLPRRRMIYTRARVLRRDGDHVRMAFNDAPEPSKRAISEFVTERLSAATI